MNKNIDQLISSYLEGDISESDKIIIEDYIRNNPDFSLKVNNIKEIMGSLNDMPIMSTSDDFISKLDQKINNSKLGVSYWFSDNMKIAFGFFSILIITLFIIDNISFSSNPEKLVSSSISSPKEQELEKFLVPNPDIQIEQADYKENE